MSDKSLKKASLPNKKVIGLFYFEVAKGCGFRSMYYKKSGVLYKNYINNVGFIRKDIENTSKMITNRKEGICEPGKSAPKCYTAISQRTLPGLGRERTDSGKWNRL